MGATTNEPGTTTLPETQQINPAAQSIAKGKWEIIDAPYPKMKPGDALVQYEIASICGSDLHIVNMGWNVDEWPLAPGYPGHEGVGCVIDTRSDDIAVGDRVLAVPHIWNSFGFAQYQAVDDPHLLPLPADGDAAEDDRLLLGARGVRQGGGDGRGVLREDCLTARQCQQKAHVNVNKRI